MTGKRLVPRTRVPVQGRATCPGEGKNYPEIINSAHAKFGSVVSPEDSKEDAAVPDDQPNSVDMG